MVRNVKQAALFYKFSPENHVPQDHPQRSIDRFFDLSRIRAHSTFTKNRHGRFRESELTRHLFETNVVRCITEDLVSGC